jgi:hypothetical protein
MKRNIIKIKVTKQEQTDYPANDIQFKDNYKFLLESKKSLTKSSKSR